MSKSGGWFIIILGSAYSCLIPVPSFVSLQQAICSAPVINRATISCLWVYQSTIFPLIIVIQVLWNFLVVATGSLYNASTYILISGDSGTGKTIPSPIVNEKYLSSFYDFYRLTVNRCGICCLSMFTWINASRCIILKIYRSCLTIGWYFFWSDGSSVSIIPQKAFVKWHHGFYTYDLVGFL